jgi:hypothetical protein
MDDGVQLAHRCVIDFVQNLTTTIQEKKNAELRSAFLQHLNKVAHVMRIVECADSNQVTAEEERLALLRFFKTI